MASLQRIKQLKERKRQSAQTALHRAVQALKELTQACTLAEEDAANYKIWRVEEELRQYKNIEKQILRAVQLDELRERISAMHSEEAKRQQDVLTLKNKCDAAAEQKERCQQALRQAEKDVEKYQLLIQETLAEAKLIQEKSAEDLLDEFASAMKGTQYVDTTH